MAASLAAFDTGQFARRGYHEVGLDDILAEAGVTKGAMYFHFRSKYAVAVAIIESEAAAGTAAMEGVLARNLSGLETLIDFSYLIAVQDIKTAGARAGLNLLASVGRWDALHQRMLDGWTGTLAGVAERAIAEGDIEERCDPHDVGILVVSLHMGLRQTSALDEPEHFLRHLETSWVLMLNGFLRPNRIEFFSHFLRRRTALAIRASSSGADRD
jgi:TetR/AcrR family transcriptional repressor of nem operon